MVARRSSIFLLVSLVSGVFSCTTLESPADSAVIPTRLGFMAQPTTGAAGATVSPAVTVAVQDSSGRTDTTASSSITITLGQNPSGGAWSGILTVPAVKGLAVFSTISISVAGAGYTLVASTPTLAGATSVAFTISAGVVGSVSFAAQPVGGGAGEVLTPPIQVAILDTTGNVVPTAANVVTIAIGANPSNATLSGTTSVAAVEGVATFSSLTINKSGTGYTLNAYAGGLRGATSTTFNVGAGAPAMLGFIAQPSQGSGGQILAPPVEVAVEDAHGTVVTSAVNTVTLQIGANPGAGTLSGTTSVAAVNGVAMFSTLSINNPATGYTLVASASGLIGATSSPLAILASSFQSISAGGIHTCASTNTGKAYCWGDDVYGELGDSNTATSGPCFADYAQCMSSVPLPVAGHLTFATVSAGGGMYSCGLAAGGSAFCWGRDPLGGSAINIAPVAVSAPALVAVSVGGEDASGGSQACGITSTGAAYCWGSNTNGQLGNGTSTSSDTAMVVSGGLVFTAISAGEEHTCAIAAGGVAYCWGDNGGGELGNGTTTGSTTPVAVAGTLTLTAISAGAQSSCALTSAGAMYCWGSNAYGQLGVGSTTNSSSPVPVSGGLVFATTSVGNGFACGVTTAHAAYCWGYNADGELGDGATTNSSTPVAVVGGHTFAIVDRTCGLTVTGSAYCWGSNGSGQIGNGTTTGSATPAAVF
jgi:alpha-tubulin suppressor-like RCC1 family protein